MRPSRGISMTIKKSRWTALVILIAFSLKDQFTVVNNIIMPTNFTSSAALVATDDSHNHHTTLVVAHYKEWMKDDDPEYRLPRWADPKFHNNENNQSRYRVHYPLYQRLDPSLTTYVPNYGFESGVYVKYIIDHYHSLPELVVFTQADCSDAKKDFEQIMSNLTIELVQSVGGFLPLNKRKRYGKNFEKLESRGGGYSRRIEDCWRQVASDFGRDDIFEGFNYSTTDLVTGYTPSPNTSTYFKINIMCCAIFAVTRERIQAAAPLNKWKAFYDRAIINGSCVRGRVDLDLGKGETGGAFEHLIAVIFGGKDALWDPFGYADIVHGDFPTAQQRASRAAVYTT